MSSLDEWCSEKLSQLLNEELRISALTEIKTQMQTLPQQDAAHAANVLELPLVFDCLNDSNKEQVDLACEVLSMCLDNLNLGDVTNRYLTPLERSLTHPNAEVKLMALKSIERTAKNDDSLISLNRRITLLENIIKCIGDEDIQVSMKASKVVKLVGTSDLGMKVLFGDGLLQVFSHIMAINEVVKLRVYELLVHLSVDSENNFKIISSLGLIKQMYNDLGTDDILFKVNIIEILTQLGLSNHGFAYLQSTGLVDKMCKLLDDDSDPIALKLSEPAIIKFFGNLSHWKPGILPKYEKILDKIFDHLEDADVILMGICIDTIGYIGTTFNGKTALDCASGQKMVKAIKLLALRLSSVNTELKIKILNCFENLLRIFESEINSNSYSLTKKWFYLMDANPIENIVKYAKNPFAEIRLAAFGIFNAISSQPWGQEVIRNTPSLIEFLLDRNVEVHKDCKQAKFEIVRLLAGSQIFDNATSRRLQAFINDGPFYVQGTLEVEIGGNE